MKEFSDEILQDQIERGNLQQDSTDAQAYRIVFNALKKEPPISVPATFANIIINRIIAVKSRRSIRRDYAWLGLGLCSFMIATLVTMALTNFHFSAGTFRFLANYGWLLAFGGLLLLIIGLLEHKIMPTKQPRISARLHN